MRRADTYIAPVGFDAETWPERELTVRQLGDMATHLTAHDHIVDVGGLNDLDRLQTAAIRTLFLKSGMSDEQTNVQVIECNAALPPLSQRLRPAGFKGQLKADAYVLDMDERVLGNIPRLMRANAIDGLSVVVTGQLALRGTESTPIEQETVYVRTAKAWVERNLGPMSAIMAAVRSLSSAHTASKQVGKTFAATTSRNGNTRIGSRGWSVE